MLPCFTPENSPSTIPTVEPDTLISGTVLMLVFLPEVESRGGGACWIQDEEEVIRVYAEVKVGP